MLDFTGMQNDFKRTDLDPRELILMYKYLLVYNQENLKKHFTRTEFTFDIGTIIDRFKMENDKMGISTEKKIHESKSAIIPILEHKNNMFTSELAKNQNKLKKFQYSKFSPFSSLIKKEKTEAGTNLKEVTAFVQTNLIKLYVEKGDQKSIYNFFSNSQLKNHMYIDYNEVDAFLKM